MPTGYSQNPILLAILPEVRCKWIGGNLIRKGLDQLKKEEAAMKHYAALAQAATDEAQKQVFEELAAMEQGHKAKMEAAFVDIGFPEVW